MQTVNNMKARPKAPSQMKPRTPASPSIPSGIGAGAPPALAGAGTGAAFKKGGLVKDKAKDKKAEKKPAKKGKK